MSLCGAAWCAATVCVDIYHALSYSTDVHFYGPVFSHFLLRLARSDESVDVDVGARGRRDRSARAAQERARAAHDYDYKGARPTGLI